VPLFIIFAFCELHWIYFTKEGNKNTIILKIYFQNIGCDIDFGEKRMPRFCKFLVLLLCPVFIFCMESKKDDEVQDYLKNDFYIRDEFVGDELAEGIRELVQFCSSLDAFFNKKTSAKDKTDTTCLEKDMLSLGVIKKNVTMSNELILLCSELEELEAKNPIIANSLKIKRSFSILFDAQIKMIIEEVFKPQSFNLARKNLIFRLDRLKKLSQGIVFKILFTEKAFDHLSVLGKITDISMELEKNFTVYRATARRATARRATALAAHQRDLICKPCKRDKSRKLSRQ